MSNVFLYLTFISIARHNTYMSQFKPKTTCLGNQSIVCVYKTTTGIIVSVLKLSVTYTSAKFVFLKRVRFLIDLNHHMCAIWCFAILGVNLI
jgi:hypothetical protein